MNCGACGGALEGEFLAREMMYGSGDEFHYAQCNRCASLWLTDPPENLADYYADGYYSMAESAGRPEPWDYYRWTKNRAYYTARKAGLPWPKRLNPPAFASYGDAAGLSPRSRVLDVGCGAGDLLQELKRSGFTNLVGVDPFIDAPSDSNGVRLIKGDLDDIDGEFDVVMLHHSLEHVPSPVETLSRVRDVLAKGGHVVVRIPLVSEAWDVYGVDWVQLDAPRHTVLFSLEGFHAAAKQAGLEVSYQTCDSSSFQFWGSEQYRLGIPLNDPLSPARGAGQSLFSEAQMEKWAIAAQQLNADMRGDQAAFVLRPG